MAKRWEKKESEKVKRKEEEDEEKERESARGWGGGGGGVVNDWCQCETHTEQSGGWREAGLNKCPRREGKRK